MCPWVTFRNALCYVAWLLFWSTNAQIPPPITGNNMTFITSPINPSIKIIFKSPPVGTCTTVFSTQKQYSGYVSLPPTTLGPLQSNFTINTFFWFIEARQLPEIAPLTVFINGGPGSSSMVGLFQEVGPCQVVEIANGQLGTQAREWGWDRSSNLIFIDQPVQVGFSYDSPTNASLNLLNETLSYPPQEVPNGQPTYSFLNGTFSSGNSVLTANTSEIAAQSIWHFLQGFLAAFPQYNPGTRPNGTANSNVVGINLFTESYGGKYAPVMASFIKAQNAKRLITPSIYNITLEIHLASVGIMNGWVDALVQAPYNPRFAYNNTYGISAISLGQELSAAGAYLSADGCQQLISSCRTTEAGLDPSDVGNATAVNSKCLEAQQSCEENVIYPYTLSNLSVYDISQNVLDPFPDNYYLEYLNTMEVQQAIGVPLNYTQTSVAVLNAFTGTGDYARGGQIADLAGLLMEGVRVALIYGDRDYICNWLGGEAISFAIAGAVQPHYGPWYGAGYAPIVANSSYIGGVVRQYGNLSFSRIYDAGHLVPAYQPETAFTIFTRIIQGAELSLGQQVDLSTFGSAGDVNSTHQNVAPPMASPTCYLRAVNSTCSTDQKNMLANEAGVIINGVLYDKESDWMPPAGPETMGAGVPGTAPTSMLVSAPNPTNTSRASTAVGSTTTSTVLDLPTGVYVATGTPTITRSATQKGGSMRVCGSWGSVIAFALNVFVF